MSSYTLLKTEFLKNGDALHILKQARKKNLTISFKTRLYLAKQLFLACNNIWSVNSTLHCDLKLDNFLISDDKESLKLCDFGHATHIKKALKCVVGTAQYRAPELNNSIINKIPLLP